VPAVSEGTWPPWPPGSGSDVGLAQYLGYGVRAPGVVRASVQRLAATRTVSRLAARPLPRVDSWTRTLTRGRHTLTELALGLPVLDLTTRGRASGRLRTTQLIAVPSGRDLALVGTNFGRARTPGWVHNLDADPRASVHYRERSVEVRARPATEQECAAVLARAEELYVGYGSYLERVRGRSVRVFVLERPR